MRKKIVTPHFQHKPSINTNLYKRYIISFFSIFLPFRIQLNKFTDCWQVLLKHAKQNPKCKTGYSKGYLAALEQNSSQRKKKLRKVRDEWNYDPAKRAEKHKATYDSKKRAEKHEETYDPAKRSKQYQKKQRKCKNLRSYGIASGGNALRYYQSYEIGEALCVSKSVLSSLKGAL